MSGGDLWSAKGGGESVRRAHAAVCDRDARVEERYARSSGDAGARAGLAHDAMRVSTMYRVSLVSLSADCVGALVRSVYLDDVTG